jgi:gliding motility-associated lipoprotein GldB
MKKNIFLAAIFLCFMACSKKDKVANAIAEKPELDLSITRFDQLFFESKPENLNALKQKFPYFFPEETPDSVWVNKLQHPLWRDLYQEVQKKFTHFDSIKTQLTTAVKYMQYYFPETKTPKIITVISEMDYHNKVIYTDSLVVISLELYLGKSHKFYQFPDYIKRNFESKFIASDLVSSFATTKIKPVTSSNFISQMVYAGKQLYVKDLLLPDLNDAEKIGYTPEQITWCKENESYIWRYFIENQLLYSSDKKLNSRFIEPAPFSKFYLEIDNQSPGEIGAWIGWQMVRAYMENNKISLQEMLQMDEKELFEKSMYKPEKNAAE